MKQFLTLQSIKIVPIGKFMTSYYMVCRNCKINTHFFETLPFKITIPSKRVVAFCIYSLKIDI